MSKVLSTDESKREAAPWESFPFTDEDFRKIASVLHEAAGIYLPEAKATLVYSRLTKRLRALGLESFRDYCALIATQKGLPERQKMIAALTTNVTTFFREPHHFEHFRRFVLEKKAHELRKGGKLRVWSAACSSGQEPYSIAMTILSTLPDAAKLDVRVLATDIDYTMVAAAQAGVYDEDAMRGVTPELRQKFFSSSRAGAGSTWTVQEKLSELVAFRELNLIGPWPMKGRFDAIFCRNVVIYFNEATQREMWQRFVPVMTGDGRLYIGHSERICGPASEKLVLEGVTTYRQNGKGAL
jgi:chemotaxis protein methyltransferase CheR